MIGCSKLNKDDVKVIRELLSLGKTHQSIGDMFGVSREHITSIANNRRWNDERRSFIMKEDITESFSNEDNHYPYQEVESVSYETEQLNLEQKYHLVKFIESLTGKKIKKLIIEMV
jgi:hypothetical protein